jgi:lysophospholipase L1-like esterase
MGETLRRTLISIALVVACSLLAASSATAATAECDSAKEAVQVAFRGVKKAKKKVKKAKKATKRSDSVKADKKVRKMKKKLKKAKRKLEAAYDAHEAACATPPSHPSPYVALGDSVTDGAPYVGDLFQHYRSTLGVTELSNRAQSGATSGSLRTGGQLAGALADIDAASDTRVVTIGIGGNDLLSGCDFTSPSCAFRANFDAILDRLRQALTADPGAEPLIALAYYNPKSGVGGSAETQLDVDLLGSPALRDCDDTGAQLGLNDIIAQEARAHGALLADAYPAFKANGQAFIAADGLHPNAAGHTAIASAFKAARAPCLA